MKIWRKRIRLECCPNQWDIGKWRAQKIEGKQTCFLYGDQRGNGPRWKWNSSPIPITP